MKNRKLIKLLILAALLVIAYCVSGIVSAETTGDSVPAPAVNEPVVTGVVDAQYNYNVTVFVAGTQVEFPDQKPFIDEAVGRTFVPVRFVSEALGATVEWVGEEQKVVIKRGESTITLTIGSKDAYVNGTLLELDAPAALVSDRTMVPLRFVSEGLGEEVNWTPLDVGGRVDIGKAAGGEKTGSEEPDGEAPSVSIEVTVSEFILIQGVIDGNILDDSVVSIVATDADGNTKNAEITGNTFRVMSPNFTAGEVVTLQAYDAAGKAVGNAVETTI